MTPTLLIIAFAPFFDSGNSMMHYNLVDCSSGESLHERTAGFYNTWRKTMEHVKNLSVVNISKLPSSIDIDMIYPVDDIGEGANTVLKHFFFSHISFLEELRRGKSLNSLMRKYQSKRTFTLNLS